MRYITLVGEMAKNNVTNEAIANLLGIHRNSAYNKLKGGSSFTVEEAIKIRDKFFPGFEINVLFKTEEQTAGSV